MPASTTSAQSPAILFIELWNIAEKWTHSERLNASACYGIVEKEVNDILELEDPNQIYINLRLLIDFGRLGSADVRGRVLHILDAIDRFFSRVHPRQAKHPTISSALKVPIWLSNIRDTRTVFSYYVRAYDFRLIAKGGLLRSVRSEYASFAEDFHDRFSSLSVVPEKLYGKNETIEIVHKVIPSSLSAGVPLSASAGNEKISIIPVAENRDDLLIKSRKNLSSGHNFVNFNVNPKINVPKRFIDALNLASVDGIIDIVISPELVVSENDSNEIQKQLFNVVNRPRLVIAGSGLTIDKCEDQHWNETAILNGHGVALWKHRKIWPAGIDNKRCQDYRIDESPSGLTFEDTASGKSITIADIDTLGRCLVMICQDIEGSPLIDEIVIRYQPDWIITPILDADLQIGGWAHQRAFALSQRSNARFLMATSTTLASYTTKINVACGLAVGQRDTNDEESGRHVLQLRSVKGHATFQWRAGSWKKTEIKTNF